MVLVPKIRCFPHGLATNGISTTGKLVAHVRMEALHINAVGVEAHVLVPGIPSSGDSDEFQLSLGQRNWDVLPSENVGVPNVSQHQWWTDNHIWWPKAFDGPGNPAKWRGLLLMVIPTWSPMNNPRWKAQLRSPSSWQSRYPSPTLPWRCPWFCGPWPSPRQFLWPKNGLHQTTPVLEMGKEGKKNLVCHFSEFWGEAKQMVKGCIMCIWQTNDTGLTDSRWFPTVWWAQGIGPANLPGFDTDSTIYIYISDCIVEPFFLLAWNPAFLLVRTCPIQPANVVA